MILHLLVCVVCCAVALASQINFYDIYPKHKKDGLYFAHIAFTTFRSRPGGFRLGDLSLDINHTYRKAGEHFLYGISKSSTFESDGTSQLMMRITDRDIGTLRLSTNTLLAHTLFHIRSGKVITNLSQLLYPQKLWYEQGVERITDIKVAFGDRLLFVSNEQNIEEESDDWDAMDVKQMLAKLRAKAKGNEEDVAALLVEIKTTTTEDPSTAQGLIAKVGNTRILLAQLLEQKWLRQSFADHRIHTKFSSSLFSSSLPVKMVLRGLLYPQDKWNYSSVGRSFGLTATPNKIVISDQRYVNDNGVEASVGMFRPFNRLSITLQDKTTMSVVYEGIVPLAVKVDDAHLPETAELKNLSVGCVIRIYPMAIPYEEDLRIDYDTMSFEEILYKHGFVMAKIVDAQDDPNEVSWDSNEVSWT